MRRRPSSKRRHDETAKALAAAASGFDPRTRNGPTNLHPEFWIHSLRLAGRAISDPYSEHSGVFGAITTIVNSIAGLPLKLSRGVGEDSRQVEAGPWFEFFNRLSSEFTRREVMAQTWTDTLIVGESMWVMLGRLDRVEERAVPVEVQVFPGSLFEDVEVGGRLDHWKMRTSGGQTVKLEPHQVLNFRPFTNPENPRRGISPLTPISRAIRVDDMAARYNEAFLGNDATPAGILSTDSDITNDQAEVTAQRWRDMHGGPNKSGKTAVLGSGVTYQATGSTHKEMEYREQREWVRKEIAEALHVPPMLMGDMSEVHSKESARTIRKLFWEGVLIPLLASMESTFDERLFVGRQDADGLHAAFDLVDVEALQEEQGARRDNAAKDRAMGFPLNEVNARHELGYDDQGESGEVGLVAFSLQTTDMAAGTDDPPKPEPPATTPTQAPPPDVEEPEDEEDEDLEEEAEKAARALRRSSSRERKWRTYDRFLKQHAGKLRTTIRRKVFKAYRAQTLAMVEELFRDAGPAQTRGISESELDAWLAGKRTEWEDLFITKTKPHAVTTVEASLERAETQIGHELTQISMESLAVLEIIAEQGVRKAKATATVQKGIRHTLLEGSAAGENLTELQGRIRRLYNQYDAAGSLRIARTETAAASTAAKYETFKAEGIRKHEWLSSGSPETRDSHLIDGETVDIGTPFSNGLLYPLDPNGPAEECVNCGCEALAVVTEEDDG